MAIVVVGAAFVDIKGFPFNTYIPKGRNAGNVEMVHGGVGRNVVEDIANVELPTRFVGMVDKTDIGTAVKTKLGKHKVDTDYMIEVDDGLGMWLAVFDETGDLVGAISKRPNMDAMIELLREKGDEIFKDADSIIIEIDIHKEIVKQVFQYAQKYNVPIYAVVANMSIASERRDLIKLTDCIVCNEQEAEILFVKELATLEPDVLAAELSTLLKSAGIKSMVVTLGARGSVYADNQGNYGHCPPHNVVVRDTTGAGDSFFAGVAIGLTYHKTLAEACEIGTRLAASVITSAENVCPRFLPEEFGITL